MTDAFHIEGLEISATTAAALARAAIRAPTPVQTAAAPVVLAGKDAVIQSATGTGKTLAYVLPLLQRARLEPSLRVVIVAPSPELAMQILRTVESVKDAELSTCSLIGGGNPDRQLDKLKKHPRVIVGTPGRVLELIFAKKLKTASIGVLVLDETDEVLSGRNEAQLREVASRPEFKPQLVFASATIGPAADKLAHDLMDEGFARINVDAGSLPAGIAHHVMTFEAERKEVWLLKLLKQQRIERALVFVNKLQAVPHLERFLNERGVATVAISSEYKKQARSDAIEALYRGKARVLVTTDAAARGLDFPELAWVIHYDVARDAEVYVHRAGRTGRAGKSGTSVMMVAPEEMFLLKRYSEALKIAFTRL